MPKDDAMMKPVVDLLVIGAIAPSLISNNVGRGLSPQSQIQIVPMYEYLIRTDAESGVLIPQLAESWSLEPNGQDFRVKLRENIPFHNDLGTVSYRDVAFTVAEFGAEDSTHPHSRNYRTVEIESVSELEFIWKLPRPLAEQERRMSEHIGGMEIMSVADYELLGEEIVTSRPLAGTAGYQFESREQESYIRFDRAPGEHWRHTPDFGRSGVPVDERRSRRASPPSSRTRSTSRSSALTRRSSPRVTASGSRPGCSPASASSAR